MYAKPDLVVCSILMRIFCRPLNDGRVLAPIWMYEAIRYWLNYEPKIVHGGKKIVCGLPLECDASIKLTYADRVEVVPMSDMCKSVTMIPISEIHVRRDLVLRSWDNIMTFTNGKNHQVGISQDEFDHLYEALGPGVWAGELTVKGI